MDIKNDTDLNILLADIVEKVILHISQDISDRLQAQIEKDVFTTPNEWYERTGEFEKAWKWTNVQKGITTITRELYYDTSEVRWNPDRWEHGNPGESAVDNLADILNLAFNNYAAGYTSDLMFGKRHFSHKRRPYWKNLISTLFDGGELDKMFEAELNKYGLVRV